MRTGNLGSLSERDRAGIKERLEFERAEVENQRLAEDQAEYQKYCKIIDDEQRRVPPAHRIAPLTFTEWRKFIPQNENDPLVRGAECTNAALLCKVRSEEAADVVAGKTDPAFVLPECAKKLRMSVQQAREFARKQSALFVEHNPEYVPNEANLAAITKYLTEKNVNIPTEECLKLAWLRLRELGMIEERPATEPAPEPQARSEEPQPDPKDELVDGWDLATGEPRKYRPYEVHRMSAEQYRLAFRVSPRFTRSRYQ